MRYNTGYFFYVLFLILSCGRISLTGIHPVASSVVDSGIIYGPGEKIIGDEDVGLYSSIGLDSNNNPVISYYDATNSRLKFASWNARENKWDIEVIDDNGDVGAYSSLIVAEDGSIWVSYYDRGGGNLRLARRIKDLWQIYTVDSGGPANYDVGRFTSIAIAPDGRIGISYFDSTNGDLMYASWDRSSLDPEGNPAFNIDSVDAYPESTGGETGMYTSLKFSPDGKEYIAYYDASNGNPKLAIRTDSGWQKLTVGERLKGVILSVNSVTHKAILSPPSTFSYSEITVYKNETPIPPGSGFTLDSPDEITILDYDGTATYTADYVTSPDQDGAWIKLGLDDKNNPAVAFHNDTDGSLIFATYDPTNGEWRHELVDSGNVGTDISLVFTHESIPVITYFDNAYMDLKIAYRMGNDWVKETIDTPHITGLWTSSIVDSTGLIHISYYQTTRPDAGDLKYLRMTLTR